MEYTVSPEKRALLLSRMETYNVKEKDLEETFIRASGRGGQKVNKTAAGVFLKHVPSGMSVKCTKTRSRALNRYYARKLLVDAIEREVKGEESDEARAREKARRQKIRRRRRTRSGVKRPTYAENANTHIREWDDV